MNGIIHNCTHSDSDSPSFRMTEDMMVIAVFNYIEHLFSKIKPKKLFFMAVDGVAPRAKMNQQRARRFRTALESEASRDKAIRQGMEMPEEPPFDSNCITPGTAFMARLSTHLRYFVNKKVSQDIDWQGLDIILSGHEVPGEGEHKIMEYIRQTKAQDSYDPNMRHCLYGLDADLIMLGLLSHDPHFCLLREEVTFGRHKAKHKDLEHQNFYLLHLCMMREYLELEFQELKQPGLLGFPFDMEHVIDDLVLMAFFVGNDFLPNLPHLHINEGALAIMFDIYKATLPKANSYINNAGHIDLPTLRLLLDELSRAELRFFDHEHSDAAWLKGRQAGTLDQQSSQPGLMPTSLTPAQHSILLLVERFVCQAPKDRGEALDLPASLPARDRKFVQVLADPLTLQLETVLDEQGSRHIRLIMPVLDEADDEAQSALVRVLSRFRKLPVRDSSAENVELAMDKIYQKEYQKWKNTYYQNRFGWDTSNSIEMQKLTQTYVQGLQWVLLYYHRGVASWPWFYSYHYSPMISDVVLGLGADLNFKLGQPFLPFQQLMGVLPDRSKSIVPEAYRQLMTNPKSPIYDFYPRTFDLDPNGKKQDWEAIVKIPFIDEQRLLAAMATCEQHLTPEEISRNGFGVTLKFTYSADYDSNLPSSLPGYFPNIEHCHCVENIFDLPTMEGREFHPGLMDGVLLGSKALAGFPSLKTLPIAGQAGFHGVSIFRQESNNESMIITLLDSAAGAMVSAAQARLGQAIFVGYPFLQEARVVKVSDEMFDYELDPNGCLVITPHGTRQIEAFQRTAEHLESTYSKKLGILIGQVESLVHVEMLKGLVKREDGSTVKEYTSSSGQDTEFATQTLVDQIYSKDPRFIEHEAKPLEEEFPLSSRAFFLGEYAYGRPLVVDNHVDGKLCIKIMSLSVPDVDFGRVIAAASRRDTRYQPSYSVAKLLCLHPLALSKITSSLSIESAGARVNLGLNLKFEARQLKVLGYSRKSRHGWEFSDKAVQLIQAYMLKFPEFIAGIQMRPQGDIYADTDFYPQAVAKNKITEIMQWLNSINCKSFESVSLDAEQLDSDAVEAIQQAAQENVMRQAGHVTMKTMNGVPRNAILNTVDADKRVGEQRFQLGDRVIYVLPTGKVPVAQRGTVVGITKTSQQTWLDVVFDTSFLSGTTLGDRCQPFFGATVPFNSVLNLSDKQVAILSKAGHARERPFQPQALPWRPIDHCSNTANEKHSAAPAPAPVAPQHLQPRITVPTFSTQSNGRGGGLAPTRALYQSFTTFNASNMQTRSLTENTAPRRGRGTRYQTDAPGAFGSNTAGRTIIDLDNSKRGVRNSSVVAAKNYRNVPPPPSLGGSIDTEVIRGRGRGLGRSRGAYSRGRGDERSRGVIQFTRRQTDQAQPAA